MQSMQLAAITSELYMTTLHPSSLPSPQVLDKNTCKLVAGEYGVLVVDKEEAAATDKVGRARVGQKGCLCLGIRGWSGRRLGHMGDGRVADTSAA